MVIGIDNVSNASSILTLSLPITRWTGDGIFIFQRSFSPLSRCFEDFILRNSNLALDFDKK